MPARHRDSGAGAGSGIVTGMQVTPRVLVLNNAVMPQVYTPFDHWRAHFPPEVPMVEVRLGQPLPPVREFTHLLLTGSEASIVEPDPWVGEQMEYVRLAAAAGRRILGSCHGHQLIAAALGGSVGRAAKPELGWIELEVLGSPAMFAGAVRPVWSFVAHFDEVTTVPPGCVATARSAHCAIHGFAHQDLPIWGVQAHPEITVPAGEELLARFAGVDPRVPGAEISRPPRDSGWIRQLVAGFLAL